MFVGPVGVQVLDQSGERWWVDTDTAVQYVHGKPLTIVKIIVFYYHAVQTKRSLDFRAEPML